MSRRRCILRCGAKSTLNGLPKDEDVKNQWLQFIFKGATTPQPYNPNLLLCSLHFTEDCFVNHAQFIAGYSKRLILKEGAVPTLTKVKPGDSRSQPRAQPPQLLGNQEKEANLDRGLQTATSSSLLPQQTGLVTQDLTRPPLLLLTQGDKANFNGPLQTASSSQLPQHPGLTTQVLTRPPLLLLSQGQAANSESLGTEINKFSIGTATSTVPIILRRHVACQTDPPPRITVGTQLTRTIHFRSKATQTKVASKDCSVGTLTLPLNSPLLFLQPTIEKRPSKRPRFSLTDQEESP